MSTRLVISVVRQTSEAARERRVTGVRVCVCEDATEMDESGENHTAVSPKHMDVDGR